MLISALFVICLCTWISFAKRSDFKRAAGTVNIISIEDIHSDLWRTDKVVDILKSGGVGVIPTDTCYSFVTQITSHEGINRIAELKGMKQQKKPLSILCKDFSMMAHYTSDICDTKWAYKLFKSTLPGPFTYILPSSKNIPKLIVEHNKHVKRFKRNEIGVRMPADDVCMYILSLMDVPLLCGSVPESGEDVSELLFAPLSTEDINSNGDEYYLKNKTNRLTLSTTATAKGRSDGRRGQDEEDSNNNHSNDSNDESNNFKYNYMNDVVRVPWVDKVDFIVENGPRGLEGVSSLSTIVDLTLGKPVVIRQGKGIFDFDGIISAGTTTTTTTSTP